MKITVETDHGNTSCNIPYDDSSLNVLLVAFAQCLKGVGYGDYEFTVEEEDA